MVFLIIVFAIIALTLYLIGNTTKVITKKRKAGHEERILKYENEYKKILLEKPNVPMYLDAETQNLPNDILNIKEPKFNPEWEKWFVRKESYSSKFDQPFIGYGQNKFVLDNDLTASEIIKLEKRIAVERVENSGKGSKPKKEFKVISKLEKIGVIFKPYNDYNEIIKNISNEKYSFAENIKDYHNTVLKLTKALKILKSIHSKYFLNKTKYHINYKSKIAYSHNSLKFEYDRKSFTIIIYTGLTFNENRTEIINEPVRLEYLEKQYEKILENMGDNLPKDRVDMIYKQIIEIAGN